MTDYPDITPEQEAMVVAKHAGELLAVCDENVSKFQQLRMTVKTDYTLKTLAYWKHARGALRWLIRITQQRVGVTSNVDRSAL